VLLLLANNPSKISSWPEVHVTTTANLPPADIILIRAACPQQGLDLFWSPSSETGYPAVEDQNKWNDGNDISEEDHGR